MSETPWTPGPWVFEPAPHDPFQELVAPNGQHGERIVMFVRDDELRIKRETNARLIASAPEMAELLEKLAVMSGPHGPFLCGGPCEKNEHACAACKADHLLSRIKGVEG